MALSLRPWRRVRRAQLVSTGTAVTNTTDETVLASATISENLALQGSRVKFKAYVKATLTHSTDTLRIRVRVGNTTLTGTAIITTNAVNVSDNDLCMVSGEIGFRSAAGSDAEYVGEVIYTHPAGTTLVPGTILQTGETGLDTNLDWLLEVTAQWSVADAGNSCQAEDFSVEVCP